MGDSPQALTPTERLSASSLPRGRGREADAGRGSEGHSGRECAGEGRPRGPHRRRPCGVWAPALSVPRSPQASTVAEFLPALFLQSLSQSRTLVKKCLPIAKSPLPTGEQRPRSSASPRTCSEPPAQAALREASWRSGTHVAASSLLSGCRSLHATLNELLGGPRRIYQEVARSVRGKLV